LLHKVSILTIMAREGGTPDGNDCNPDIAMISLAKKKEHVRI